MVLSELIRKANELLTEHGDLEILDGGRMSAIDNLTLLEVENDDDYPKDWNMPKGTKVAIVHYDY